ncbi:MAG: GNAT family N-acetyltransferase [Myxococcota bacterium]
MKVQVLEGLGDVDEHAWNTLAGDDDPFVEYAFLRALETSGTVGESAGWLPLHLAVWDEDELIGALPLYLKDHSYGEYIFDWGWADAGQRLGLPYYPKLVSMAPVTPATGRRLLIAPGRDRQPIVGALIAGLMEVAKVTDASSIHLLFLTREERSEIVDLGPFMPRLSMQYHWHNEGYEDFDDYLAHFRASHRKKVRRERRSVADAGLTLRTLAGNELEASHFELLRRFYRDTCGRKGSYPYLTNRFFDEGASSLRTRAVAVFAERDGNPVAATLNFQKGPHLYGRYWGCSEDYEMLHFELCYYSLIERAIATGVQRFEAGAQGSHKLRRGLLPREVHSAHWIRDPRLQRAVADFLPREAYSVKQHIDELMEKSPFKRS